MATPLNSFYKLGYEPLIFLSNMETYEIPSIVFPPARFFEYLCLPNFESAIEYLSGHDVPMYLAIINLSEVAYCEPYVPVGSRDDLNAQREAKVSCLTMNATYQGVYNKRFYVAKPYKEMLWELLYRKPHGS